MRKLSTSIVELDLVLGGGLNAGATVILAGPAGTGKTILAHQICFANATADHKAIYYTTLSEPHSKLVEHLNQFAFFDPIVLGSMIEHIHLGDMLRGPTEDVVEPLISEVVRTALEKQPAVIVIDSVKMLRDFVTEKQLRTALYDLTSRIAHVGTLLLLLGEYTAAEVENCLEFAVADGIIQLAYESREPLDRRWLRVAKMRGANPIGGKQTFRISDAGFEVFPRIASLVPDTWIPMTGRIPTGIPRLDTLMGGGIPTGDSTVVLGPSGAGKTVLCLRYLAAGLEQDRNCLYITFQDTAEQLMEVALAFGWDFSTACKSGQLVISYVPPGGLDLDMLSTTIRRELHTREVSEVVIDGLPELGHAAREGERFPPYLRSLIVLMSAAGASLMVTAETATVGPQIDEPLNGLVSMFHNVIQLRHGERHSEVERSVNVMKMRKSDHDRAIYSYSITPEGLTIGAKLSEP
jgi:circadian clock protein KaiC